MELERTVKELNQHGYKNPVCIGRGTFGEVYRVTEAVSGRSYACKVSRKREMLQEEGRLLAALNHPLYPLYRDFWQSNEQAFLVMEYVPGENLDKMVKRRGGLSTECTAQIVGELAAGLLFLHEQPVPVYFRDLKPQNIRIRQDGRVKLLDFGCACREGEDVGTYAGTVGFAAPEQFAEEGTVTAASDVYALGKLIQFMLDGRYDKSRKGRHLRKLSEACIHELPRERIPSMRSLLRGLSLHSYCKFYKIRQDIWKTSYKFDNA